MLKITKLEQIEYVAYEEVFKIQYKPICTKTRDLKMSFNVSVSIVVKFIFKSSRIKEDSAHCVLVLILQPCECLGLGKYARPRQDQYWFCCKICECAFYNKWLINVKEKKEKLLQNYAKHVVQGWFCSSLLLLYYAKRRIKL